MILPCSMPCIILEIEIVVSWAYTLSYWLTVYFIKVSFLFFFFPLLLGRKLITLKFIVSLVKVFLLVSCTLWLNFVFVGSHYFIFAFHYLGMDFPGSSVVKNLPANARDGGLIPGSGISLGEGNDNPLQDSCLGKPMDRGAWWATVHGVAKELDMT